MLRGLLFVIWILVLEPGLSESNCQDRESQKLASDENPSFRLSVRNLLKRYNDIDYDSFVGLMGRRSTDAGDVQPQRKREMHDIFVGLMGRRNSDAGESGMRSHTLGVRGGKITQTREAYSLTNAD
ncbi:tachykinin-3a isoform X1 [Brachyhypopomus gauderio]|uniref:tachykinin-3a isoform X1 n=1 Tax=Brachyhypopomus gauderio TaxID=698409 RepID=UPI0040423ECD